MKNKHIALIPARKGSVGFKFKNRLFFDRTADFLDSLSWFDSVVVSSNDKDILDRASKRDYEIHQRLNSLSDSNTSIKAVMKNVIDDLEVADDTYIWLFYLPILYKNKVDFENFKKIISNQPADSFCSFVPAEVHPFNCWSYDKNKLKQYIPNDSYRRQDLPEAWMHYHYLCAFKASEIDSLNSELISEDTYPIFLDEKTTDMLVEVDTLKDYEKWKRIMSSGQLNED